MDTPAGDELVEWIDEDGHILAVVPRSLMRSENLRHRSVGIFVQATDGRLLVHRRSDAKDLRPGWWDVMAGGVVGAGEPDDHAARRELAEELGIVDAVVAPVGVGRWDDTDSKEICRLYRVVHDGPYRFADGEVTEARLVDADALAELRRTENFLPGSLSMLDEFIADGLRPDGDDADDLRLRCGAVHRVEFTIEPFVEGQPGLHVTRAIDAVRALGHEVEVGPFGSAVAVPAEASAAVVAAITREAFAHGADHVNIDIEASDR